MSSRNLRLNEEEKNKASLLHTTLIFIRDGLTIRNFSSLKNEAYSNLEKNGFKLEYLELARRCNLESVSEFSQEEELILLVAAFLNDVRLIDNLLIQA